MHLAHDIRHALRRLLQSPGYSFAIVAMLACGIAIGATMFGTLQGVFGALPFPQSERLVVLEVEHPERGVSRGSLTPAEALALEREGAPFADFGFYVWGGMTVYQDERPREFNLVNVSSGFFSTLGMPPLHGSWFAEEDFANSSDAVILSYQEWQRLFAGDPAAIGKTLETGAGRLRVAGVMPASFAVPSSTVGAWRAMPRDAYPMDQPWVWNARFVNGIARLDPALGDAQQAARLAALATGLAERHGLAEPLASLQTRSMLERIVGGLRGVLWGAFAVALLVLLIACANVAILVDARQTARRHEQAVVQALGASRTRLFRTQLIEVLVLALLAVALGLAMAMLGIEQLRDLARSSVPRVDAIAIDLPVLVFAGVLGLLAPVFAALAGALRPRADAVEAMRSGGRGLVGRQQRRGWLPMLGAGLSTVSLVAGSALLFSLWKLQAVDTGITHERVYALQLFHGGEAEAQRDFARRLAERLAQLPGVDRVATASSAPLSIIGGMSADIKLPERDQAEPFRLAIRRASPDYLAVLDIALLAGRGFMDSDRDGAERVALVNQELARRLFGDQDPLGRRVELPLGNGPRTDYRIVGVVEDSLNTGLRAGVGPELLVPFEMAPSTAMTFLVRSQLPLGGYEKQFTDALFEVDPREASTRIFALSDEVDAEFASARFFARTVGAFALAALLLAAFGVYAVAALRQQQRVAEFGLRLAIGARPGLLIRQMLGESLLPVLAGIALGTGAALGVLRLLQNQLFGIEGAQLGVVGSGIAVLLVAALAAALIPAWRAARTEPMVALRHT